VEQRPTSTRSPSVITTSKTDNPFMRFMGRYWQVWTTGSSSFAQLIGAEVSLHEPSQSYLASGGHQYPYRRLVLFQRPPVDELCCPLYRVRLP
jgi:hypothetical protein